MTSALVIDDLVKWVAKIREKEELHSRHKDYPCIMSRFFFRFLISLDPIRLS